jgi:thiol-disulfide isomerase/thioredoxin
MLRAVVIALALCAAAAAGFVGQRLWERASPDETFRPDVALPDLSGTPQPLSQWDGDVVLVNFWATWCAPCEREVPLLEALQREYGPRGVQVVGIALDEVDAVREFAEAHQITYPLLVGEQEAVDALAAFGAEMTVLPYTAFVRRDGRVAKLHVGELERDQAVSLIESLL